MVRWVVFVAAVLAGCQSAPASSSGELGPPLALSIDEPPTTTTAAVVSPMAAISTSSVATSASDGGEGGPVVATRVERYGAKQSARIVVFLSRPAQFGVGELAAAGELGPRIYVDVVGASYVGPKEYGVGGIVEQVRLGTHPAGLRVVLDLQQPVYKRVFYLPEPPRLVVDVSKHPPRSRWHVGDGKRVLRRVVLDPGHGGHDPGATGFAGLLEKDVALDVAHRAAPLIARELGIDTLLTRDNDEYVALDERVAKANAFGADLFISIHCNASESMRSHGVMSFVLDASGDTVAQHIAARENAASKAATLDFEGRMRHFIDAATAKASVQFAELLQRSAMASLSPHYEGVIDGGVRRAGFFVLAGAQMPAVLFEASFISNPTEEQRLHSPQYRQRVADALVNAVRAYREAP